MPSFAAILRAMLRDKLDELLDAVFTWALYRSVKGPRRPPPRTKGPRA